MTAHDPGLRATRHWRDRVQQRIGPDVDPDALARILGAQIAADSRHVEYRGQAEFQSIATRIAEATGLPLMFGRAD